MPKSYLQRAGNTALSLLRGTNPAINSVATGLETAKNVYSMLKKPEKVEKIPDKTKVLTVDATTKNAPEVKKQSLVLQRGIASQGRNNAASYGSGSTMGMDNFSGGEGGMLEQERPETPTQTTTSTNNISGNTFDLLRGDENKRTATQSALDKLRKGYVATFDKTDKERALEEELASFREAANMGILGEEGQGRGKTLSLVRGRQEKLLKQAGIQEQSLLDRINLEKSAREQEQNRLKTELGFTEKDLESTQAPAPIEIGGSYFQLDPVTGQYKQVYSAPTEAAKPISVSPGQTVIDPTTGQVIFTAPEAPKGTDSVKTATIGGSLYQYNPMTGAWDKAIQGSPASNVPTSVNTDIANSKTLLDLISQVEASGLGGNIPGVGAIQGRTPGFLLSEQGRQARFTLNNIIGSIALLRGGASFSEGEKKLLEQYVPTQSDTDNVIASKLTALKNFLNTKITNMSNQFGIVGGSANSADQAREFLRNSGRGYTDEEIEQAVQSMGFTNDLGTSQNGLGTLSERYESGGNPGAIGYDSTGGYSYGTYQLAHNNAQNFIAQSPYANDFNGLSFNSRAWRSKWKEIANKDPQGFAQAQKQYIEKTHYLPQVNKLAQIGIDINSLSNAVKNVIWSTAVQHGANTNIVQRALARMKPESTEADLIRAIYEERWGGGKQFASSTPQVRQSVYNRFFGKDGELNKALSMLG